MLLKRPDFCYLGMQCSDLIFKAVRFIAEDSEKLYAVHDASKDNTATKQARCIQLQVVSKILRHQQPKHQLDDI